MVSYKPHALLLYSDTLIETPLSRACLAHHRMAPELQLPGFTHQVQGSKKEGHLTAPLFSLLGDNVLTEHMDQNTLHSGPRAAMTKDHRLSGLSSNTSSLSQFWRLAG